MKPGLRAGAVAVALAIASYGVIAATHQSAAAERAPAPTQEPPSEVKAADTKTTLPDGSVADVLVDDVHDQAFVGMTSQNSVIVADFDGAITKTITGISAPGEMTLSADSSTVYAIADSGASITAIDASSHTIDQVSLPSGTCAKSITYTGGKVWFTHQNCSADSGHGVGAIDPATKEATTGLIPAQGLVRALPDRADRLVAFDGASMWVYDVSGETPAEVAAGALEGTRNGCRDAALTAGGDHLVTACHSPEKHEVFNTADLSAAPAIASGHSPNAIAVTPDGKAVAAGLALGWYRTDIFVADIRNGTPGSPVRTYEVGYSRELANGTLAFNDAGTLFAVETTWDGQARRNALHLVREANRIPTAITLTAPKHVQHKAPITATGMLNDGPGVATTASLTRTDRSGSHDLGSVPVAADGSFSFTDTPDVTAKSTYSVRWPGNDTHASSDATAAVQVRPLPYDVNGDGYAETVVGVPGEDIGSDTNTGMFHVLPGTASGATGSGSRSYHQDTAGVPGAGEDGDWLGLTNASGDFNGDGYADVAVSDDGENIGSVKDAGAVLVFYGSATGLTTSGVTSLYMSGTWAREMYFGQSMTAGDFNGDGIHDLAIGGPGAWAGYVFVFPGAATGLARLNYRTFDQDESGVPGTSHEDDLFGWAVSAGDVNGDGYDDLAVGAIYDWEDRDWSTGSATVLYGSASGLTGSGAQRLSKDTSGVPGVPRGFNPDRKDGPDNFGFQLQLADLNGDGKADLGVTAPQAPVWVDGVRKRDAGTLTIMLSDGSKITGVGSKEISQQTAGMPGTAGYEDHLGSTLAAGDSNGDGKADLAVYSPGDNYVTVVRGGTGGLVTSTAKGWTQNSSGIPGSTEKGDYWGASLRFADIKGTGYAALIVGAEGENSYKGAITVIYSTSSGLTGTGAKYFSQNSTGISGTAENGDGFGTFY